MRIACLQFSPHVGDIDNNLNRADAVLNKAKPEELESLDLLVLPEMAFSGYNFKSLHHIHPYLEPSGSGISSLWARTTALKFNTKVLVGYPEKVDVREKWPASPEYYDSAIMVNGDGETVLNYRKRFLYKTDETWALEGDGGFYNGNIPGLGKTVVGICMDLNPYRFESPWNAFEFGFHALEVEPHLIIVTMAWVTSQETRIFSRMLGEPDMETLKYWVQRLEPLISAELEKEVIVVFCNRCGQEDDILYAGTSAIIGIKGGEVNVYALAGRGTKEFLMADTSNPPFAKLVLSGDDADKTSPGLTTWPATPHLPPPARSATANAITASGIAPANSIAPPRGGPPAPPLITTSHQPRRDRPSPRIQIPDFGTHAFSGGGGQRMGTVSESPNTIPTPEAPSPTPLALRPMLVMPETSSSFEQFRKSSPYPREQFLAQQFRFFGGQDQLLTAVPPEQDSAPTRYYWRPSDTLLNAPFNLNLSFASSPESDSGPQASNLDPLTPYPGIDIPTLSRTAKQNAKLKEAAKSQTEVLDQPEMSSGHARSNSHSSFTGAQTNFGSGVVDHPADNLEASRTAGQTQSQASSLKQRSVSRSGNESRRNPTKNPSHSLPPRRDGDAIFVIRPGSAADSRPSWLDNVKHEPRPESPKSRNTSRNRSRTGSTSQEQGVYGRRPSDTPVNGVPVGGARARSGSTRPLSRTGRSSEDGVEARRPTSRSASHHDRSGDSCRPMASGVSRLSDEKSSPEMAGTALPKPVRRAQSPGSRFAETRPISRGRQRWIERDPPPPYSETPPPMQLGVDAHVRQPPAQAPSTNTNTPLIPRQVSITRMQSASGLVGIRFATPEDEIIAIEEYIDPARTTHSRRAASANAISHKIPSIEDGRAIVDLLAGLPPPPPVSVLGVRDEYEDRRALLYRAPSVLGGSVKTTIIDIPHTRPESGVSVLSPALSARTDLMSPLSPRTEFGSEGETPSSPNFNVTPRAMALSHFVAAAKRKDTPVPALMCQRDHKEPIEEPLRTGPLDRVGFLDDDMKKVIPSEWVVTEIMLKRRSW